MKRSFFCIALCLAFVSTFLVVSCSEDSPENSAATRTLVVFMPWTGNSGNLLSFFKANIDDMKAAMKENKGLSSNNRVVVFLAESQRNSRMFELTVENGECKEKKLKSYSNLDVTTSAGIAAILRDAAEQAPAHRYAMIVGGHGVGWVRAATFASSAKPHRIMRNLANDGLPLTRFFGGYTAGTMIDIVDFAQGITDAGMKMEYVLFDDCYMSNVEAAYDLRNSTDYLIACPAEMMNYGMPYRYILAPLLAESPDYASVCGKLVDFYNSYTYQGRKYPYATIAVTDCSKLDDLAAIMRQVNAKAYDEADLSSVQVLDGYDPSLFYDLGDYVRHICKNAALLSAFQIQLAAVVPYKNNTPYYFTSLIGSNGTERKISEYSGLTVSDLSQHPYAADKHTTSWWKNTH